MNNKSFQLKLKIAWFKNFLGLAVYQVNGSHHYSLTPYYFWPRTEAWEQIKLELDSKLWLTEDEKIKILKTTSDVMRYWLSYRNKKTSQNLKDELQDVQVLTINTTE